MQKKNTLKKLFIMGFIIISSLLYSKNIAYADDSGIEYKAYPVANEGYYQTENGSKVYNAIAFVEGTEEYSYYNGYGIEKLWFNTKEGGFGAYTPALKTHSPLWLKNPGLIYQNTQIGKASFADNSGTQVQNYRTLKGGRVNPNDQSLLSYQAGNGTSFIESAPFEGADDLIGQSLEFRFMGYTEYGTIISNPYFPADNPTSTTNSEYNWDATANLSAFGFIKSELDQNVDIKKEWIDKYLLKDCITGQSSDLASVGNADYWVNRFIIAGNPAITTGVWIGSRGGGTGYRTVTTSSEPKPNLRMSWLEVQDSNGNRLGQDGEKGVFSRYYNADTIYTEANGKDKNVAVEKDADGNEIGLDKGGTYHAVVYVNNTEPPSHTSEFFSDLMLERYIYYGQSKAFENDSAYEKPTIKAKPVKSDKLNTTLTKNAINGHYNPGAEAVWEYDFTVPEDAIGYYKEALVLPKGYSMVIDGNPSAGKDDFASQDNDAYLIYKVNPNDLTITDIIFINEDGTPTTEPDPTKKYKIQYVVKYNGGNMATEVPVTIKDIAVISKGGTLYSKPGTTITKNVKLNKGDTTTFETEYMEITEPYIKATGTVSSSPAYNEDEGKEMNNNTMSKFIKGSDWNLTLTTTSVDPVKTKVSASGKTQSYVVNYQVNYLTPTSVAESSLDTEVTLKMTSSVAGSKTITQDIALEKGLNDLSFEVPDVELSGGNYDINFELMVNPNRNKPGYEAEWPDDNKDSIKASVVLDTDSPCLRSDTNTENNWTQKFTLDTWTGRECDKHGCHKKHKTKYEYVDMYEKYEITKFDFTSKLESDLQGEGTKVDLMSNDGRIKAGYGFTLDLEYIYKTNRKIDQPDEWSGCESGQQIKATKITSLTVPNKVFVELPDGQLISNTTDYGATALLDCSSSGSALSSSGIKVKCSVKKGNTFGVKTTNKLYIDENTQDGTYPMAACLEEFSGVPNKTGLNGTNLYDKVETNVKVEGSYKDDIKLHIR